MYYATFFNFLLIQTFWYLIVQGRLKAKVNVTGSYSNIGFVNKNMLRCKWTKSGYTCMTNSYVPDNDHVIHKTAMWLTFVREKNTIRNFDIEVLCFDYI